MGVNVVNTADGANIVDMTGNTVTEDTLGEGVTAQNAQGETITGTFPIGEVNTQADLIEQIKTTLAGKAVSSGGGSGIIDVTELPTENIDENAVYRLTTSIQTEKTEIYIIASGRVTIQQYLTSLGVPTKANIYAVDELPADMLPTDIQTFTQLHFYILKSNGVAYAYVPAMGGVITGGLFGFQSTNYDKGFTENIYNESDTGVYTTIEKYKQIEQWFVRENGEWKEITAHTEATTPHGCTNVDVYSGDVTSKIPDVAELVSGDITEVNEEWFRSKSGIYIDRIRGYAFQDCTKLTKVTLPNSIRTIHHGAFSYCDNLTTINVPWAEGEVDSAPWGATNATINYNYTEG